MWIVRRSFRLLLDARPPRGTSKIFTFIVVASAVILSLMETTLITLVPVVLIATVASVVLIVSVFHARNEKVRIVSHQQGIELSSGRQIKGS